MQRTIGSEKQYALCKYVNRYHRSFNVDEEIYSLHCFILGSNSSQIQRTRSLETMETNCFKNKEYWTKSMS